MRHLLSGLLVCGTCGGAVTIVGGQKKQTAEGVVDYRTYGCTNRFRKGREFCTNGKTTSLRKLESAVIGGLQREVLHPQATERFIQRFRARVAEGLRRREPELKLAEVELEQAKLRAEVDRLIEAFATGTGASDGVQRAVAQREARLAELQSQAETLRRLPKSAGLLPHDSVIKRAKDR